MACKVNGIYLLRTGWSQWCAEQPAPTDHLRDVEISQIMPKNKKKDQKTGKNTGNNKLHKNPLSADWSLQSGRIPHMNDPRVDNKIYRFTMNVTIDQRYTTSTSVPTLSGDSFSLNTFAGYSTKIAVFDQYRIAQLEAWIVPTIPVPGSMMHSAVDYDNGTAPGSIAAVQAYGNCHSTTMQNGHYHKWVPHTAAAAYKGAFTGYQNNTKAWIDSAYPDVTLFGLKVAFEITSSAAVPVNLVLRAVVEFRNPFA